MLRDYWVDIRKKQIFAEDCGGEWERRSSGEWSGCYPAGTIVKVCPWMQIRESIEYLDRQQM